MPTRRQFLTASLAAPLLAKSLKAADPARFSVEKSDHSLNITSPANHPITTYHLTPPKNTPIQSAAFFHPLHTPLGQVVTDLAPADHPHHRGVFLAFVETHTHFGDMEIAADFWGWGQPAPTKNRRITNHSLADLQTDATHASFKAKNLWQADDKTLLTEDLQATLRLAPKSASANILDLAYTLTPAEKITLSRWAFSGFCARTLKNIPLTAVGPNGIIPPDKNPNPSHTKPETDWPDAPWYAYELQPPPKPGTENRLGRLPRTFGIAVLNHPQNPKTLWHNHRDVRMLNPCVVAPAALTLTPDKPLTLRYTIVAFDGGTPVDLLNTLAKP
jgi:hypothetical protein